MSRFWRFGVWLLLAGIVLLLARSSRDVQVVTGYGLVAVLLISIERTAKLGLRNRELRHESHSLAETLSQLSSQLVRHRTVIENAGSGILTTNASGIIASSNKEAQHIFGFDENEMVGARLETLFAQSCDVLKNIGKDAEIESECVGDCESEVHRSDGSSSTICVSARQIQLNGEPIVIWIVHDITERNTLEQKKKQSQTMDAVGQLAAGVAHEINSPVQFIGDNLTFLQKIWSDCDSLFDLLQQLHEECKLEGANGNLCRQIDDLTNNIQFDFIRSELPQAIVDSVEGTTRVAEIVQAMKSYSYPTNHQKSLSELNNAIESSVAFSRDAWKNVADINLDLDASLPLVPCAPSDLKQAFTNLITNSAQAIEEKSNESGQLGSIEISTCQQTDHVEIRISDNGIGIPIELRERIFEPFFTTRPPGMGVGQGLSIAYSIIVGRHAGKIGVESEVGQGTTISILLPLQSNAPVIGRASDRIRASLT